MSDGSLRVAERPPGFCQKTAEAYDGSPRTPRPQGKTFTTGRKGGQEIFLWIPRTRRTAPRVAYRGSSTFRLPKRVHCLTWRCLRALENRSTSVLRGLRDPSYWRLLGALRGLCDS